MSRLNIRIPVWLKAVAKKNSDGNLSKYIKKLILQDNTGIKPIKKISCVKKVKDNEQDKWPKKLRK